MVTAGDVLELLTLVPPGTYPNMDDRRTSTLEPGHEDYKIIHPKTLSGAILASGSAVFHYKNDPTTGKRQCLSVRDVAALQSYPNEYEILGNTLSSLYKQVGNSVPRGLASALARSAAEVLRFVYRGELEEDGEAIEEQQQEEEVETHPQEIIDMVENDDDDEFEEDKKEEPEIIVIDDDNDDDNNHHPGEGGNDTARGEMDEEVEEEEQEAIGSNGDDKKKKDDHTVGVQSDTMDGEKDHVMAMEYDYVERTW